MLVGAAANSSHSSALLERKIAPRAKVAASVPMRAVFDPALVAARAITAVRLLVRRMKVLVAPCWMLNVLKGGHPVVLTLMNMKAPSKTPKKISSDARNAQTPSRTLGICSKNPRSASSSSGTTNLSFPYPYSATTPNTAPGIACRKLRNGSTPAPTVGIAVRPRKKRNAAAATTIGHLLKCPWGDEWPFPTEVCGASNWTVPSSVILGDLSKLCNGGGEGMLHSRVEPSQGLGPAGTPFLALSPRFAKSSSWASPKMKPPMVARLLREPHPVSGV